MSRKDYIALALSFVEAYKACDTMGTTTVELFSKRTGVKIALGQVADTLRATQPNFDRARFVDYALERMV